MEDIEILEIEEVNREIEPIDVVSETSNLCLAFKINELVEVINELRGELNELRKR